MADNRTTQTTALATIPDATVIATDDCGAGGHTQVVKLAVGTGGDATLLSPATSTLQTTGNTALDAIKTAVEVLDNIVSGSEAQVDIVAALPAGTNAIGKLAANSGVDIGDVDVTSVPADPFGVNADAASATGSISAKLRFIAATGIPVTAVPAVTSATLANVSASASNVTLLSSNAARKGAMIANDSASAVYVKFGATASTTSFTVKIAPYGYYEFPAPCYTGIVDGIWDTATGSARTTEV